MKKFGFVGLFAMCVLFATPSLAQQATRVECTPFFNGDKTQVLITAARAPEKCGAWATTNLIYTIDLKVRVLCVYISGECIRFEDMASEERQWIDPILAKWKMPLLRPRCEPITDGEKFLIEGVPINGSGECGNNISTVRVYNRPTRTVSVMDGKGKIVGTLRDVSGEYIVKAINDAFDVSIPPPVRNPKKERSTS